MWGYLIKYSDMYGTPLPERPIELISGIPKEELIATIVGVNTKLKPHLSSHFDRSRETQIQCFSSVFLNEVFLLNQPECLTLMRRFTRRPANQNLFTRVTCLYALQEIINHNDFTEVIPQYTFEIRERIFKFLLLANEAILTGDKNYKEERLDQLGEDFFEYFMFRELHHNQYNTSSNIINTIYKSAFLFKAIEGDGFYGPHFRNYLTWKYQVESTGDFFKQIVGIYSRSHDEKLKLRYINVSKTNHDAVRILDSLSMPVEYEIPADGNLKKFDFLPLKKSPLYKCAERDEKDIFTFLIMDEGFYIEKCYSLFINDFWFEYLQPNEICDRKQWGKFIGSEFFEKMIEEIFSESFSNSPNIILRSTEQLVFNIEGRPIEYADFYIREKQNVALLEVKSGFIPLDYGYKTVSTMAEYQTLDIAKFNKDYGLTQLAEKTIKKFHLYKNSINDPEFNADRKVQIYPVIVVNDPIISSSIVTFVLKRKFRQLLEEQGIKRKEKLHNIKDLSIINISHLQELEQSFKDNKANFFNILDHYLSISNLENPANYKNNNYLRTFDHVVNNKIADGLIAERHKDLSWLAGST